MKKNQIIAIVLVLVILGIAVTVMGRKSEAPVVETSDAPALNNSDSAAEIPESVVKEFTVSGENFSFDPSEIKVKKGDKVKITFKNSQGFHDFKIDKYGVATKQTNAPSEEVLEFTADKAGTFEYYCSVGQHRAMGMKGNL